MIWDPTVPATVNVATTIAGVENAVVLSPELADSYLGTWKLPVLKDLRGQFTGTETGSKKNDAYRWAIREYLARGRCSAHRFCLFEDALHDPLRRRYRLRRHARLGRHEPGLRLRPLAVG